MNQPEQSIELPKVSIIVTAYLPESKRYLDLTMRSIENLNYPKERLDVIVVGRPDYLPQYPNARTVCPPQERFHNPVGVNYGASQAAPDSTHLFITNDDVIFTRNMLLNLIWIQGGMNTCLCPIMNCHNHFKYALTFSFMHEGQRLEMLKRFFRYEEWEPYFDSLMQTDSLYPPGLVVQDYLCLVAFLIPKVLWEKVGGFDEGFKTGQDDIDFCKRLKLEKIPLAMTLSSLLWHFGGASSSTTMTDDLRKESQDYFESKWGERAPT